MEGLSTTERTCVEQAMAADMLRQVEAGSFDYAALKVKP